jgi:hypothetical protein
VRLRPDGRIGLVESHASFPAKPNGQPSRSYQDFCLYSELVKGSCQANQLHYWLKLLVFIR